MARGRRRRRGGSDWFGGLVTAGAAVGVWIEVSHRAHAPTRPAQSCPKSVQAGACMGHALDSAARPYIVAGLAGALIGLLVAVVIIELRRALRRPRRARAPRRVRAPIRQSTVITAAQAEAPAVALRPSTPALTKPELHALRLKIRKSVLEALRELNGGGDRHDILSRALSIGGFTARELQAPAPLRHRKKYSRQIDHDLAWSLTDLKRDGLVTNPARGTWRLTEAALIESHSPIAEQLPAERLTELQMMPYDEYLRTPEWNQTRAVALVRADHCCALDPKHAGPLEVHHRYYERRGAELPNDLIVLCRACHQLHHKQPG